METPQFSHDSCTQHDAACLSPERCSLHRCILLAAYLPTFLYLSYVKQMRPLALGLGAVTMKARRGSQRKARNKAKVSGTLVMLACMHHVSSSAGGVAGGVRVRLRAREGKEKRERERERERTRDGETESESEGERVGVAVGVGGWGWGAVRVGGLYLQPCKHPEVEASTRRIQKRNQTCPIFASCSADRSHAGRQLSSSWHLQVAGAPRRSQ